MAAAVCVQTVGAALNAVQVITRWTVDLEDCDRVLRIETASESVLEAATVIELMNRLGFSCSELP
ncbi:copper chaperone CopZ [Spirosoma lacussanchae]